MSKTFYVTTPIYYVNDVPHIGHAYTTIAADVLARFKRMDGYRVHFLTGTDEHGQKIERAAESCGEKPIELADRVVERFENLWTKLDISYDDFIRTSQERHKIAVTRLFDTVRERGDIYLGEYEDWYCVHEETFCTEQQLVDGKCPTCNRPVEKLKEESYFFRMSAYQERLLGHIEENPDFIRPESRRNEILSFVREGLRDLSISRTSFCWGIPVPNDPRHVIYVWFDALTNYLSAIDYLDDPEGRGSFWPADVHLIGKDILRHHAVYWPTFLMSAGIGLPKKIFAHGWWTVEGEKMSKSLGNFIDPGPLADEYGVDQLRYFLMREVPFGLDGDFSMQAFKGRINSDLANDLGNLLNRFVAMNEKYQGGRVLDPDEAGEGDDELAAAYDSAMYGLRIHLDSLAFNRALIDIWRFVNAANKYIDRSAPWTLKKEGRTSRLTTVMYNVAETLRIIAMLIYPFMPGSAVKIWEQLGLEGITDAHYEPDAGWGRFPAGTVTRKGAPLFPRIC